MAFAMCLPELWHQSPTMLQPVGGMDAIARAFARALGSMIRHNEEVVEIEPRRRRRAGHLARSQDRTTERPRRGFRDLHDSASGAGASFPPTSPSGEPCDQIGAKVVFPAVKVAFEAPRRWWEIDQQLYGGISWTGRDITQIWYPSHGFHSEKGVLVGAYIWNYVRPGVLPR